MHVSEQEAKGGIKYPSSRWNTPVKVEPVEIKGPLSVCFVKAHRDWLLLWRFILGGVLQGIPSCKCAIVQCLFSFGTIQGSLRELVCFFDCSYASCVWMYMETRCWTHAHVYEIECIPWNVFWFLMLRGGGGSTHYVRGYFHCVPLLRPEEREFSPLPNKGSVHRQWLHSTGILTWPCLRGGKPFTALLLEAFQLRLFFFFWFWTARLWGFSPVEEILASRNHIFHCGDFTVRPHLGFVAGAGHPALEEAEGPADFVLLWLNLRRDYVLVPLLILDPVALWTFQSVESTSMSHIVLGLKKTAAFKPNMHTIIQTYHYGSTFNILRRAG